MLSIMYSKKYNYKFKNSTLTVVVFLKIITESNKQQYNRFYSTV